MRVVLVGRPADRARLRAALSESGLEIVGESATLPAGLERAAGDVDAYVVAPADRRDADAPIEPLTPRELEVLQLLAEGLPNKGIASRLGISDQTVKFHVASICGKLGALNRTSAVRTAIARGLIAV